MFSLACLRVLFIDPRLIPPCLRMIRAISSRVSLLFARSSPNWSTNSVSNWALVRPLRLSSFDTIGSLRMFFTDCRVPSCQVSDRLKGLMDTVSYPCLSAFATLLPVAPSLYLRYRPTALEWVRNASGYSSLIRCLSKFDFEAVYGYGRSD